MAKILIVDDEAINRDVLIAFLDQTGHELLEASGGAEALRMVEKHAPDLLLLDVMMPDVDGLEVVRRLRATRQEFLPIVLVTALTDQKPSRVEGLNAGADDFLSKPVDSRELALRTANLLRLRSRERELQRLHVEQAELHRFKDDLGELLVHDLKNPMAAVIANLNLLRKEAALPPPVQEALTDASIVSQRVLRLIQNLHDVGQLESEKIQMARVPTPLAALVQQATVEQGLLVGAKGLKVTTAIDAALRPALDAELMTRLVATLFDGAVRGTPAHGRIDIAAAMPTPGRLVMTFGHDGAPIPVEVRPGLLEKYGQADVKVGRSRLGHGLYFCRLVAEAHGGSLTVTETAEQPVLFRVELAAA